MSANNLLVIDIETSGFSPENDQILEVAGAIFNVPCRNMIWQGGGLIPVEIGANPAEHVNGITTAMMAEASQSGWDPMEDLQQAVSLFEVDALVAHNADFERGFLGDFFPDDLPWIDTIADIRFPRQGASNKLDHVAVDHGVSPVGVPFRHRAIMDVVITCALLAEVPDLERQIVEALKPRKMFVADVSYENRGLAKEHGFIWDRLVPREWARKMPFDTALEPTPDRPFAVRAV